MDKILDASLRSSLHFLIPLYWTSILIVVWEAYKFGKWCANLSSAIEERKQLREDIKLFRKDFDSFSLRTYERIDQLRNLPTTNNDDDDDRKKD